MDLFEAVESTGDNQVAGWVQTTDGVRLWVTVQGTGRPIVMLHGWTMSSLFWRRQFSLAEQFQVITIDLRGHGKSQTTPRGHTLPRYATDVREVLMALHLHNVMLVGWSMGGAVALEFWNQFGKDRLEALGLVESAPAPMSSAPWNTHKCRGNDTEALQTNLSSLISNRKAYADQFIDAMFLSGQAPDHASGWMKREQLKASTRAATTIYEDYATRDYTPVLPTITIPTLVVYGRSRHMCYGPSTGRYVAGSIQNSRFVILDKSGHLPFYEEPDVFNEALTQFMNKIAP